jgi:putative hydrolase of the HAD superfamily
MRIDTEEGCCRGASWAGEVQVVGLDGDDTLWRCQEAFDAAQEELRELLRPFADAQMVDQTFDGLEATQLALYGYGVKTFTLCAVETAARLAGPALTGQLVRQVLGLGQAMLAAPVELLPGAADAVEALRADGHRLALVTKGDLIDQERKLAASGLSDAFDHVEILSDKTAEKYDELLRLLACPPSAFLMVGNSMRSDVGPVLALGGLAVHVPYHTTWHHEHDDAWRSHPGLRVITILRELPAALAG